VCLPRSCHPSKVERSRVALDQPLAGGREPPLELRERDELQPAASNDLQLGQHVLAEEVDGHADAVGSLRDRAGESRSGPLHATTSSWLARAALAEADVAETGDTGGCRFTFTPT
jgi:hypothetical protein